MHTSLTETSGSLWCAVGGAGRQAVGGRHRSSVVVTAQTGEATNESAADRGLFYLTNLYI